MQLSAKRFFRKLPYINNWKMFQVLYSQAELERLEYEMKRMQFEYDRLTSEGDDVLEETRRDNRHVSSELRIRELVRFKASRLKGQMGIRMRTLEDARKYVE